MFLTLRVRVLDGRTVRYRGIILRLTMNLCRGFCHYSDRSEKKAGTILFHPLIRISQKFGILEDRFENMCDLFFDE